MQRDRNQLRHLYLDVEVLEERVKKVAISNMMISVLASVFHKYKANYKNGITYSVTSVPTWNALTNLLPPKRGQVCLTHGSGRGKNAPPLMLMALKALIIVVW